MYTVIFPTLLAIFTWFVCIHVVYSFGFYTVFKKEKLRSADSILIYEELLISINVNDICYSSNLYWNPTDWIQENCISTEISDKMCCGFSRSTRFFGMCSALTYI